MDSAIEITEVTVHTEDDDHLLASSSFSSSPSSSSSSPQGLSVLDTHFSVPPTLDDASDDETSAPSTSIARHSSLTTSNVQRYSAYDRHARVDGSHIREIVDTSYDIVKRSCYYYADSSVNDVGYNANTLNDDDEQDDDDADTTTRYHSSSPSTSSSSSSSSSSSPSPSPLPSDLDTTRQWNEEFQRCVSMPAKSKLDRLRRSAAVYKLSNEFAATAMALGKRIIQELSLPPERKTIPQVHIGGIAGGDKYIAAGILFKFATDSHGLYGSDEMAMKAAAHEMKGLRAMLGVSDVPDLSMPLLYLIDFLGYRLVAASYLPITQDTLVYGSADGGKSVLTSDAKMNRAMRTLGKKLNLKEHLVGPRSARRKISMPADIEGHKGNDGRYYVVDFARLMPPQAPSKTVLGVLIPSDDGPILEIEVIKPEFDLEHRHQLKSLLGKTVTRKRIKHAAREFLVYVQRRATMLNERASFITGIRLEGDVLLIRPSKAQVLCNLLRPELVLSNPEPLSPDAFTGFGKHNSSIHNRDVLLASERLFRSVIPSLVQLLNSSDLILGNSHQVCQLMKSRGINLRHLGYVRLQLQSSRIRQLVLGEMVSRIGKNVLRSLLRNQQLDGGAQSPEHVATQYFNLLLGASDQADAYWLTEIKVLIALKYGAHASPFTRSELANDHDLRTQLSKNVLFTTLQKRTGVIFTEDCRARFQQDPSLFDVNHPLAETDIKAIHALEKRGERFVRKHVLEYAQQGHEDPLDTQVVYHALATQVYGALSPEVAASHIRLADLLSDMQAGSGDAFDPQSVMAHMETLYASVPALYSSDEGMEGEQDASSPFTLPTTTEDEHVGGDDDRDLVPSLWAMHIQKGLAVLKQIDSVPAEILIGIYSAQGRCLDRAGDFARALLHFEVALDTLESLFGGQYANGGGGGHPYAAILLNNILACRQALDMDTEETLRLAYRFFAIWNTFTFHGDETQRKELFGAAVPLPLHILIEADVVRAEEVILGDKPSTDAAIGAYTRLTAAFQNMEFEGLLSDLNVSPKAAAESLLLKSNTRLSRHGKRSVRFAALDGAHGGGGGEEQTLVYMFGLNSHGQLGLGDTADRSTATVMNAMSNKEVVDIACGRDTTFLLTRNGHVYATGDGQHGRLGQGNTYDQRTPVAIQGLQNIQKIAAGDLFLMALDNEGHVFSVGYNLNGELGLGDREARSSPCLLDSVADKRMVDIVCGKTHTYALDEEGRLWAWGQGKEKSVPEEVSELAGKGVRSMHMSLASNDVVVVTQEGELWVRKGGMYSKAKQLPWTHGAEVVAVTMGTNHMFVLSNDGKVHQMQRDDWSCSLFLPLQDVQQMSSSLDCTMFLCADNRVYGMGAGAYGKMGCGDQANARYPREISIPAQHILRVVCGSDHTVVLATRPPKQPKTTTTATSLSSSSGSMHTASLSISRSSGKLSAHALREHSSRQRMARADSIDSRDSHSTGGKSGVGGSSTAAAAVAAGYTLSVEESQSEMLFGASMDETGEHDQEEEERMNATSIYGWGQGNAIGAESNAFSPVELVDLPSGMDVVQISAKGNHTLFLSASGGVYAIGSNNFGQCGVGSSSDVTSLTKVRCFAGTRVVQVATGYTHSYAITDKGEVYAWGSGLHGELGMGVPNDQTLPRRVEIHKVITQAVCGENFTMLCDIRGNLYTFGARKDRYGVPTHVMGHGDGAEREEDLLVPRQVKSLTQQVICIGAGSSHAYAVCSPDSIYAWGSNRFGKLGVGHRMDCPKPQLLTEMVGRKVVQVACGHSHVLMLTEIGEVFSCGSGKWGATGLGKAADVSVPSYVRALQGVHIVEVAAGYHHSAALSNTGRLYVWGLNARGALGIPSVKESLEPVQLELRNVLTVACGAYHTFAVVSNTSTAEDEMEMNGKDKDDGVYDDGEDGGEDDQDDEEEERERDTADERDIITLPNPRIYRCPLCQNRRGTKIGRVGVLMMRGFWGWSSTVLMLTIESLMVAEDRKGSHQRTLMALDDLADIRRVILDEVGTCCMVGASPSCPVLQIEDNEGQVVHLRAQQVDESGAVVSESAQEDILDGWFVAVKNALHMRAYGDLTKLNEIVEQNRRKTPIFS